MIKFRLERYILKSYGFLLGSFKVELGSSMLDNVLTYLTEACFERFIVKTGPERMDCLQNEMLEVLPFKKSSTAEKPGTFRITSSGLSSSLQIPVI